MIAKAWYCGHEYFRNNSIKDKPEPVILNETHFECPVQLNNPDITSVEDMLTVCFSYYNWVQYEFAAPTEVNEFAKRTETHASLSVGDVIQIEDKFYACCGMGWQLIDVDTAPAESNQEGAK